MKTHPSWRLILLSLTYVSALSFSSTAVAQGTNLIWSQSTHWFPDWDATVQDAADHVEDGFDNWRLPTVDELVAATQDGTLPGSFAGQNYLLWTSKRRGSRAYAVLVETDGNGDVIPGLSGEVWSILRRSSNPALYVREGTGAPQPGITVSPTTSLSTHESGNSSPFNVVLDTAPAAPVSILVSSGDTSEGLLSTTSQGPSASVTLFFDASDWDQPQTVNVIGQDDAIVDGNINYWVLTAPAASADAQYNGVDAADVPVTNYDDDQTVVTLSSLSPATLNAGETINVTISGSGFASGATVTFENGSGPSPSASNLSVVSDSTITCSFSVGIGGPRGTRLWDVRVTNSDSSTGVLSGGLTVTK